MYVCIFNKCVAIHHMTRTHGQALADKVEAGMALENKIIELTGEINTLKRFRV